MHLQTACLKNKIEYASPPLLKQLCFKTSEVLLLSRLFGCMNGGGVEVTETVTGVTILLTGSFIGAVVLQPKQLSVEEQVGYAVHKPLKSSNKLTSYILTTGLF